MTEDVEKAGRAASAPHPKDKHPQRPAAGAAARPGTRLDGDLEAMVASNPDFRISWRGYDQLQVDNYVAWGDTELRSSRAAQDQTMRASTETATRLGACQFELEQTRQDLAEARAAAATQVSERLRQILHLAAEEAEELRAGGQDEAERIRAAADANADEIVEHAERKAQAIMEEAGAQHDRIATEAQQLRADAARLLEEAKAEAARLIDDAQAEAESLRDAGHQEMQRLAAQAEQAREHADTVAAARREEADRLSGEKREHAEAVADARLAKLHAQLTELVARRHETLGELRQLHERIGAALVTAGQEQDEQCPSTPESNTPAQDAARGPRPAA